MFYKSALQKKTTRQEIRSTPRGQHSRRCLLSRLLFLAPAAVLNTPLMHVCLVISCPFSPFSHVAIFRTSMFHFHDALACLLVLTQGMVVASRCHWSAALLSAVNTIKKVPGGAACSRTALKARRDDHHIPPSVDALLDRDKLTGGGPPRCPLIAVLRGVESRDLESVAQDLLDSGMSMLSIHVGAPAGLESIGQLRQLFGDRVMVGAATVTSPEQVDEAADAEASFISCPHTDPEIIARAIAHKLLVMPGVTTLSEAFTAIKHGARVLKLFPSSAVSPETVKSMKSVLPKDIPLLVSGGVTPESMASYIRVGASGFALGSTLYKAGMSPPLLRQRAENFVAAWQQGEAATTTTTNPSSSPLASEHHHQGGGGGVRLGEEGGKGAEWTVPLPDGAMLR